MNSFLQDQSARKLKDNFEKTIDHTIKNLRRMTKKGKIPDFARESKALIPIPRMEFVTHAHPCF